MSIHIIIDGYNLIRSSVSLSRQEAISLEEGRKALIARLTAYRRIKPLAMTVVFDAGEGFDLAEKRERTGGMNIVYSPAGRTADQVIISMARRMGNKALVVTSDRALAEAAEAAHASSISSPEFEDRLEMTFYMETKGLVEDREDIEPTLSTRKKGPSRRLPKAQRRKASRLKKI